MNRRGSRSDVACGSVGHLASSTGAPAATAALQVQTASTFHEGGSAPASGEAVSHSQVIESGWEMRQTPSSARSGRIVERAEARGDEDRDSHRHDEHARGEPRSPSFVSRCIWNSPMTPDGSLRFAQMLYPDRSSVKLTVESAGRTVSRSLRPLDTSSIEGARRP
jgi:hypothetical protein